MHIEYNADGSRKRVFEYDESDVLVKETLYNTDGSYHIFEYESGRRVKLTAYNADGNYCIYELDKYEQPVKATEYNADGSVSYYYIYGYDEYGNKVITKYDSEGNVLDE